MLLRFFAILICTFLISACSGGEKVLDIDKPEQNKPEQKAESQIPVETLYLNASNKLDSNELKRAASLFNEVEREYPYSKWATKAQVMSAYAHYKDLNYDEAIFALDRFIQLHPGDENVDYAYYLKALSYYEQISDVRRDQKMTELALDNLSEVKNRFPSSTYARDAQLKIDLTLDHLAGKEMEIGRFYMKKGHYQAGLRRFQNVVNKFETTTQVPEALYRMVEAYLSLGIINEARKSASILGHNFPGNIWYQKAYNLIEGSSPNAKKKSLLSKIF